ncbi:MAG: PAS-domain containing protein [Paracoccaceae bacterium]
MRGETIVSLSANDLLIAVSAGLILFVFVCWRLYYVAGRREADPTLTDGAVLLISDGMVKQASDAARLLLGPCENQPAIRVLDDLVGENAARARDAVTRLEMMGEPMDMLVRGSDGRAFELIGTPSGAMIRLVIRDASLMDVKLRDAEQRISAADSALQQRQWEQETLNGLISEAPIIAWHRNASGEINWSGGEIRVRNTSVTADQAVDLIVARTKLNRQPVLAGQPQKSRIEIVINENAETASLHVVEIIRPDGSRIGLATDAGTAASAERTLTRFVQTMTETFAHLTVGLAIFDRNQTLALFNPALVQMWQVEPAWLARRPSLRDIIDELRTTRRLPELKDFHTWRSRLLGLFENTEAADYEDLWHLADGSNIRVLARPHPHGSLAFIFDDVTERVRLEQRYRHSIDLRRATLDRLTEGIAVFGANGLLQFVNQAFHDTWGTDSETIYAAMHARQLISLCEKLSLNDPLWQRLHSFITGEENRWSWSTELQMGSGRVLQVRVAPLPDGSTMAVFSDRHAPSAEPGVQSLRPPDGPDRPGPSGAGPNGSDVPDTSGGPTSSSQDGGETCDLSEALSQTAKQLNENSDCDGSPVTFIASADETTVHTTEHRLRQILFNLGSIALACADSGARVQLGGDGGTGEEFSVFASTTGTGVDSATLDPLLAVSKKFAANDGGEIEIEANETARELRLVCRFSPARKRKNLPNQLAHARSAEPDRAG